MNQILVTIKFLNSISLFAKDIFVEIKSKPFYPRLVINQLYEIGYKSWPLIFVISASTGLVLSLQFGFTLEKYGGTLYIPRMLATSLFREICPVFTAIMLAGKVGAGIAAEVASMKISQQIDAMRALGTSPIKKIVIPRVIAAFISIPLLSIFSCFIGYIFGALGGVLELRLDFAYFTYKFFEHITMLNFVFILVKPFVFSLLISITGCYFGLSSSNKGERGVGNATASTVVYSSVMIVIANFILTKMIILVMNL